MITSGKRSCYCNQQTMMTVMSSTSNIGGRIFMMAFAVASAAGGTDALPDTHSSRHDLEPSRNFFHRYDDGFFSNSANIKTNNSGPNGSGGGVQVEFTIDMLTMALIIASIFYCFCLILSRRKFALLHRMENEMTTKKLLILSVALVSLFRIMTILGVAIMNIANVKAHYKLHPTTAATDTNGDGGGSGAAANRHQQFYDEAMTVLFDLPNVMVVSTYVLLTLVWAECFLESRLHTQNSTSFRKQFLIFFMVFNTALYVTQITLYACIFLAPFAQNKVVRNIIYVGITGINFTAVVLVLIFFVYLNVRFSGFPYKSQRSQIRMARVSSVMSLWTMTRVIWGIATLLVFKYDIELLQDSDTPVWSFVVLLLMFFVCEILPIVALLDYSYLSMIGIELVEIRSTDGDGGDSPLMDTSTDAVVGRSLEDGVGDEERSTTSSHVRMGPLLAAVLPLQEGTPTRRRAIRWQDETSSTDPLLPTEQPQSEPMQEQQDQNTSIISA